MKHTILLFAFCLLLGKAHSQLTPSTFKEVYNFQAGDTFVYSYHSQKDDSWHSYTDGFIMAVITGVVQTDSNRFYLLQQYSHITNTTPPGQYSGLYSAPGFGYMFVDSNTSILMPYMYTDTGCATVTDTVFTDSKYEGRTQSESTRACFESSWNKRFVPGLGQVAGSVYQSLGSSWWQGSEFEMVYYHKADGSQWGMPHNFVMEAPTLEADETRVSVYPNPATDVLQVKVAGNISREAEFVLYDAVGREVQRQSMSGSNLAIQRADWCAGVYYWQLQTAGKTVQRGKVIFN